MRRPELDSFLSADTSSPLLKNINTTQAGTTKKAGFLEKALDTTIGLFNKGVELYHKVADNSIVQKLESTFMEGESSFFTDISEILSVAPLIAPASAPYDP